jgi:peptidoglycan/LPS O-acetylase OafA/YrhL
LKPVNSSALDALRALAALWVFLRHAVYIGEKQGAPIAPDFVKTLLLNGWLGVDIFFAISGFVIYLSIKNAKDDLSGFYWRRAKRIVPAYAAVIGLVLLGAFPGYNILCTERVSCVLYHVAFMQDYLGSHIVIALWSLGVEAKFYLLAPLLFALCLRLSAKGLSVSTVFFSSLLLMGAVAYLSVVMHGMPNSYAEFFGDFRSPLHACVVPLFCGMLVGHSHTSGWSLKASRSVRIAGCIVLLFSFAAVTTIDLMGRIDWFDLYLQPVLICVACSTLLLFAVQSDWQAVLPLVQLGKISYSFYLIHVPLVPLSIALTPSNGALWTRFPLFLLIFFLLTVAASTALYLFAERPFYRRV